MVKDRQQNEGKKKNKALRITRKGTQGPILKQVAYIWNLQLRSFVPLYPSRVTGTEDIHPSNFALRLLLGLERLLRDGRAGWLMGPSNEVLRQFIGKTALFGVGSLDLW